MKSEKAVKLFLSGLNCSQAIVCTYGADESLAFDLAAKISCGLAGGLETCGAVSGAILVLGMAFASPDPADRCIKEHTYEIVSDFNDRFKEKLGTVTCRELLKKRDIESDCSTEENRRNQIHFCANIVSIAAILLEETLIKNRSGKGEKS